jgi:hypothetical protein
MNVTVLGAAGAVGALVVRAHIHDPMGPRHKCSGTAPPSIHLDGRSRGRPGRWSPLAASWRA